LKKNIVFSLKAGFLFAPMIYVAYTAALVLVLVSLLAVLTILMQRPSTNAGMGAALGGGAAESALGGDAANVLSKLTYSLIAVFFVLSFGLYLIFLASDKNQKSSALEGLAAPTVSAPAQNISAPPTPPAPVDTALPPAPAPVPPSAPAPDSAPAPAPASAPAPAASEPAATP
jgi:preprotein translocase subunit SecG